MQQGNFDRYRYLHRKYQLRDVFCGTHGNGVRAGIPGAMQIDQIFVDASNNIYLAGRISKTATVWKTGLPLL